MAGECTAPALTLTDCTISGNSAFLGGGVYSGGTATMTDCTISGNSVVYNGAGVYTGGTATMTGCTISGNSAAKFGGGLFFYLGTASLTDCTISGNSAYTGGGLVNDWNIPATLTNCTIAGNSASFSGGLSNFGNAKLTACTVSGNSARISVGGIYDDYGGTKHATATLTDTIVAGNTRTGGYASDIGVTNPLGVTGTYDLIGTGGSGGIKSGVNHDIVLSSIAGLGLSPLGDYGGPTQTMALLIGSVALGKGIAISGVATDERGFGLDSPVDIGAFQAAWVPLVVAVATDGQGAPSGELDLRAAVNLADVQSGNASITFDSTTFATAQTISLTSGALVLTGIGGPNSITGPAAGLTIVGGSGRVLQVNSGVSATITGLTISGGSATAGGGLYNAGTVTLIDCTLMGDTAGTGGGLYNRGTATIEDCTITGDSASDGGGLANTGALTLAECTVSGNTAGSGGGVYESGSGSDQETLNDTIVAGNLGSLGASSDIGGSGASRVTGSYDLIGTGGSGGIAGGSSGDIVLTSLAGLGLSAAGEYGGPAETLALLPGSLAIGAGSYSLIPLGVSTDERGEPRVVNGTVDIGAFESQGFTLTPVAGSTPQGAVTTTAFAAPLAVTVAASDPAEPVAGGVVTFTVNPVDGASASPSSATAIIGSSGTAQVSATANDVVGGYSITATVAGASAPASFSLTNQVQPVFSGLSAPSIIYGTATVVFSGSIAAGVQVPAGATVAVTVDGSTQSATIDSGGAFSATFTDLDGLGAAGSPYPVVYAFSSEGIFADASQATELAVTLATPTVSVSDAGGTYDGSAIAASATVAGVVSGTDNTLGASLEGVAPSLTYYVGTYSSVGQLAGLTPLSGAPSGAGTYTVLASFPGSADYVDATALADFSISQATPTLAVSDASGSVQRDGLRRLGHGGGGERVGRRQPGGRRAVAELLRRDVHDRVTAHGSDAPVGGAARAGELHGPGGLRRQCRLRRRHGAGGLQHQPGDADARRG